MHLLLKATKPAFPFHLPVPEHPSVLCSQDVNKFTKQIESILCKHPETMLDVRGRFSKIHKGLRGISPIGNEICAPESFKSFCESSL